MQPQIVRVPARAGVQWLRLGLLTFWRRPWIFALLMLLQLVGIALPAYFIPALKSPLMALAPFFSLAVVLAAAQVDSGQRCGPATQLMTTSRKPLRAMLALGALYALSDYGFGLLMALYKEAGVANLAMLLAISALMTLGSIALYLVLWPAPGLIHCYGQPLSKALLLSAGALLRNWRAFVLFVLTAFGVYGVVLVGSATLLMLAGIEGKAFTAVLVSLSVLLLLVPSTSTFFMLRDCFAAKSPGLAGTELRAA